MAGKSARKSARKSGRKSAGKGGRKSAGKSNSPPPTPPPPPPHPDKDRCLALVERLPNMTLMEMALGAWTMMSLRMNGSRDKNRAGKVYDNTLRLSNLHVCVKCLEYLVAEGDKSCIHLNLLHCCYAGTGFNQHLQSSHNSHGVGTFDDLQEVYVFSSSSSFPSFVFIHFRLKGSSTYGFPREWF